MDEVANAVGSELVLKDEGLAQATTGLWTGVAGMGLAMIGPFTCYTSYLVALPCGLVSLYTSWRAYDAVRGLEGADAERNMATVGLVTGALTSAVSGMAVLMFAMIAAVYFAIFAFSLIGAAASG
jgi:hypothetical protein